jgi:SAM-dependent methyltransferase
MELIVASWVNRVRSVADLGCGAGRYASVLHCKHYYGYDITTPMIAVARERVKSTASGGKVEFAVADVFHYISDRRYDAVIMIDVAQHMKRPLDAVRIMLSNWAGRKHIFTVLEGEPQQLLNSVVVGPGEVQALVHDLGMEIFRSEPVQVGEETSFRSVIYGVSRNDCIV